MGSDNTLTTQSITPGSSPVILILQNTAGSGEVDNTPPAPIDDLDATTGFNVGEINLEWTAVGDGLMDVSTYVQTLAKSNPGMPVFVESISNSARPIPFLTHEHWKGYPNLKAADIVSFLKLCRRGHSIDVDKPAPGTDEKEFEQQHQRTEFLKSIDYLRKHCNAGLKY